MGLLQRGQVGRSMVLFLSGKMKKRGISFLKDYFS